MPWKFVCDIRFHEVLQTTKGNDNKRKWRNLKNKKKQLKTFGIVYKSLCVFVCVCVCVCSRGL